MIFEEFVETYDSFLSVLYSIFLDNCIKHNTFPNIVNNSNQYYNKFVRHVYLLNQ